MVLITRHKLMREYSRRDPYKKNILEVRAVGAGLYLLGSGLFPLGSGVDVDKKLAMKMARKANMGMPKGRLMKSDDARLNKQLVSVGRRLTHRPLDNKMLLQINGNGVFSSIKTFARKGLKMARETGKKVFQEGKKSAKRRGKEFLNEKGDDLVRAVVNKASELGDKGIEHIGRKSSLGADLATVLKAQQLKNLEDLGQKGLARAKSSLDETGSGLRKSVAGRQVRGRGNTQQVSGRKFDLYPQQAKSLGKTKTSPVYGSDRINELNNLIMSTRISSPKKKGKGLVYI